MFLTGSIAYLTHFLFSPGHNWGSEHDPSGDCSPGTILGDGKYLMYAYAVTGEDPNNDVSGIAVGVLIVALPWFPQQVELHLLTFLLLVF